MTRIDVPQLFQKVPWLRDLKLGTSTMGEVLPTQMRFGISGTGTMSGRQIVPQSPAAVAAMAGARGARLEQVLKGMLSVYDGHEGHNNLQGIMLSTSKAGFAANAMVASLDDPEAMKIFPGIKRATPPANTRKELEATMRLSRRLPKLAEAQNAGTINLGPRYSRMVMGQVAASTPDPAIGGAIARLVTHEAQHGITPPKTSDLVKGEYADMLPSQMVKMTNKQMFEMLRAKNWLEEASADTTALLPGKAQGVAGKMGLGYQSPDDVAASYPRMGEVASALMGYKPGAKLTASQRDALQGLAKEIGVPAKTDEALLGAAMMAFTGGAHYPMHVSTMRELLSEAGIDAASADGAAAAEKMLQRGDLLRLPGKLAHGIIAKRNLAPELYEQLRLRIRDLGEDASTDPTKMMANLESLKAWLVEKTPVQKPQAAPEDTPPAAPGLGD